MELQRQISQLNDKVDRWMAISENDHKAIQLLESRIEDLHRQVNQANKRLSAYEVGKLLEKK